MKLMHRRIRYSMDRLFSLYHLCYYFSKNHEPDADRKLILDFKRYEEPAIRRLLIAAIENLQWFDIDNDVLIVRALNSREMQAGDLGGVALDRLGMSLASVYDCNYMPSVLFKKRKIPSVKALNIRERKAILRDVYGFYLEESYEYLKILIIDDIVTTGATASAIIRAILKALPKAEIAVFALAWTPTVKQQEYLQGMDRTATVLAEPEVVYGKKRGFTDEDFESGETDVSLWL